MTDLFIVNVEAAIYRNNSWLIIQRSDQEEHAGGQFSLVGGKVEKQEDSLRLLEENVKREVYEEIGLELKDPLYYVHSTFFETDTHIQVINIVFLSLYSQGKPVVKSKNEIGSVEWMNYEKIIDSPEIPTWTKNSIKLAEELRRNMVLK